MDGGGGGELLTGVRAERHVKTKAGPVKAPKIVFELRNAHTLSVKECEGELFEIMVIRA